jgi:SAM-dependent methyltransferase
VRTASAFWRTNVELAHLTPSGARWAEGPGVARELIERMPRGTRVLDFGCGDGRLVPFFHPADYHGVDINPHAIAACRSAYPRYSFDLYTAQLALAAQAALCYTVLLHVPDEELSEALARLTTAAPRVLVVEILGRKWRSTGGVPATFNRSREDYSAAFGAHGFVLWDTVEFDYARYEPGTKITLLEYRRG